MTLVYHPREHMHLRLAIGTSAAPHVPHVVSLRRPFIMIAPLTRISWFGPREVHFQVMVTNVHSRVDSPWVLGRLLEQPQHHLRVVAKARTEVVAVSDVAFLKYPRETIRRVEDLLVGVKLAKCIEDLTRSLHITSLWVTVMASGSSSAESIARDVRACRSHKVWFEVFVCGSGDFHPVVIWMLPGPIKVPAIDFAYHCPHSIWVIVFELDLLLLAFLSRGSASISRNPRY
jgi:hypothetical protein